MIRRILVCGNDRDLLTTRAMVLATAPFEVEVVVGIQALRKRKVVAETKLIVLCHSLSDGEQDQAIRQLQQLLPTTPVLILTGMARAASSRNTATLDSLQGPRSLISLSQELTAD